MPAHTILNFFLVFLKVSQKLIFLRIKVFANTFHIITEVKLGTYGDVVRGAQYLTLYIQIKPSISQHIQPPLGMKAEYVHRQLLHYQLAIPQVFHLCIFHLKVTDNFPKLLLR